MKLQSVVLQDNNTQVSYGAPSLVSSILVTQPFHSAVAEWPGHLKIKLQAVVFNQQIFVYTDLAVQRTWTLIATRGVCNTTWGVCNTEAFYGAHLRDCVSCLHASKSKYELNHNNGIIAMADLINSELGVLLDLSSVISFVQGPASTFFLLVIFNVLVPNQMSLHDLSSVLLEYPFPLVCFSTFVAMTRLAALCKAVSF